MDVLYLIACLGCFFCALQLMPNVLYAGTLKSLCLWGIFIGSITWGYTYWQKNLQKWEVEVNPMYEASDGDESMLHFKRSRDGHFYIPISFGKSTIICLVDTGATNTVLTRKYAKSLGVDLENIKYTKRYNTANGKINAAPIVLKNARISNYVVERLEASIPETDATSSCLLGMSALAAFEIRMRDDDLVLFIRKND